MTDAAEVDPQAEAASRIREDIAGSDWAGRLEDRYPRALDLLADLLEAIARPLRGVAAYYCGTHGEDRWRRMLRGVAMMPLYDVARIFVEPTKEARAAGLAILVRLASAIGMRVVPEGAETVTAHQALAGVASTAGALMAELSRGLEDGRLDPQEAKALEPELAALRRQVEHVDALLAHARSRVPSTVVVASNASNWGAE